MEQLISKMSEFTDLQGTMKTWCKQNSIEQPKILIYHLERISKIYEIFLSKYGSYQNSVQPIWYENELILFQWTVIALSMSRQIYLCDFKSQQIQFLSEIFRQKENYIIDYEIKCMLVKGKQIRNAWKVEEQAILSAVVQKSVDKNKWNQIARQLYKNSDGKYFRQGKHCRERWFSYMENRKPGRQCNIETDIQLLEQISAIGKRWSQMANKFTKPQSRLTLRKRFKALLQQAYTQLGRNISQREAVSFLLQKKYEKLSYSQNNAVLKKGKKSYSANEFKSSTMEIEKSSSQKESSSEQDGQQPDSKIGRFKCKDIDHPKINVEIQSQKAASMDPNWMEHNQKLFVNGIQTPRNICNVGYVPMQYYPEVYPIMSSIGVESFSYSMNGSGYPTFGPIMFYL